MRQFGYAALCLSIFLSSVIHVHGAIGHFAAGFFAGLAIVLFLASKYQRRQIPERV